MSKLFAFFCSLMFFATSAFAQVADPVTNAEWVTALMNLLSTAQGMPQMALVAAGVQLLMQLFKTPLGEYAGRWRLVLVSGLTLLGTIIAGVASGSSVLAMLLSGAVLSAMQVFVNQLYKQFKVKQD